MAKKIPWQRHRLMFVALTGALVTAAIAGFGLAHKADYALGLLGFSRTAALSQVRDRDGGAPTSSVRATAHSLAWCFFYGALCTKILVVRSRTLPHWALPISGGVLVAVIIVLWYSSALWFLSGYHLPFG